MAQDVILGLAAGLSFADLRPFLASLAQTGSNARLVLFTTATTSGIERIRAAGAETVAFALPRERAGLPLQAWRYFLYRDWLAARAGRLCRVLLTDTRDVFFQRDPFAFAWPGGLNLVLEHPEPPLGGNEHTARWVRGHFGEAALAEIAERTVSCSGTVLADAGAAMGYLEAMCDALVPFAGGARMAGYDQGVHNRLLYTGRLGRAALHDLCGPVLTLATHPGEPLPGPDGLIRNESGNIPCIVHQYDRKPNLHAFVRERFA